MSALANPQKDAEAIAASLRNIGFETVTLAADATREKLLDALRNFTNEAEKADWAVVYYAGHGIEVNGQNYLIPVDAKLETDRDMQFEAVPLDQVMASLEGARKLKLVLLDACRDNPFMPPMRKTVAPDAWQLLRRPAEMSARARSAAASARSRCRARHWWSSLPSTARRHWTVTAAIRRSPSRWFNASQHRAWRSIKYSASCATT